jgi:hypothetical protein
MGRKNECKLDFGGLHSTYLRQPQHLSWSDPIYLAEALGTTADYLIGIAATWKGTKGPSGKVRQVFEQVSKLPRRQQEKVVEFVEAFVQHKAAVG